MTIKRDKKDAFDRLAASRMDKMKKDFKLIKNLANHYNYDFNRAQTNAILRQIKEWLAETEAVFANSHQWMETGGGTSSFKKTPSTERATVTAEIVKEVSKAAPVETEDDQPFEPPQFLRKST